MQTPTALCQCGCGQATALATKTRVSRGHVKGQPLRYVPGHSRRINRLSYVRHRVNGQSVQEHAQVAERALGRPLPRAVEVHHVDENRRNNANQNLVICQDRAYHQLLHVRARVVHAGGDPNTQRICSTCRQLKLFADFSRCAAILSDGLQRTCRACQSQSRRAREAA